MRVQFILLSSRYDKEEKVTAETNWNPPMAVNELRLVFLT